MIWYLIRTVTAEIFEAIKEKIMCDKHNKCQAEKTLAMDCSQLDLDCDFFKPIQTVPEIDIEDLVDAKFSAKDINNPGMFVEKRKAEAFDRLMKDVRND